MDIPFVDFSEVFENSSWIEDITLDQDKNTSSPTQAFNQSPKKKLYESNYLQQDVGSLPWNKDEDNIILTKFKELGPAWDKIAKWLPNRTSSDIHNRYTELQQEHTSSTLPLPINSPTTASTGCFSNDCRTAELDEFLIDIPVIQTEQNKNAEINKKNKKEKYAQYRICKLLFNPSITDLRYKYCPKFKEYMKNKYPNERELDPSLPKEQILDYLEKHYEDFCLCFPIEKEISDLMHIALCNDKRKK